MKNWLRARMRAPARHLLPISFKNAGDKRPSGNAKNAETGRRREIKITTIAHMH